MGGFVNSVRQAMLDHYFGKAELVFDNTKVLYLGLSSTTPGLDGSNFTEPVIGTNGYARVACTVADWNAAVLNGNVATLDNLNAFTFPAATGGPWLAGVDITDAGLFVAATGGTPIAVGSLPIAKPILENDIANYAAGDLDVTLAGV